MNFPLTRSLVAGVLVLSACSDRSSTVSTGFVVSASQQETTVAQSPLESLWNLLVERAFALVPEGLKDKSGKDVTVSDAWIVLKEIQFKSEEDATDAEETADAASSDSDSSSDGTVSFKGPYVVDLLSEAPSPLAEGSVPSTGIRRVKMKLHKATGNDELPADAPAELENMSVLLRGSVDGHAFSFLADETTVFQVAGPDAVEPQSGRSLVVAFGFNQLFDRIDLSAITADTEITADNRVSATDPCPEIENNAQDLYTCFRKGLELTANFGVDENDDGDLSSEEPVVEAPANGI